MVGGAGGSGVIVFRIPINYTANFGIGISATQDTSSIPNYRIYTVTSGLGFFTITRT